MTGFKKVFLDTAPFIYYLEGNPQYNEKIKSFLDICLSFGVEIVTSTISIEEYCVYPYRTGNEKLIINFYSFLKDADINVICIDKKIAETAAKIRANYNYFKGMDALQLASATTSDCDLFITNDKQLKQFSDIKCILISELDLF